MLSITIFITNKAKTKKINIVMGAFNKVHPSISYWPKPIRKTVNNVYSPSVKIAKADQKAKCIRE